MPISRYFYTPVLALCLSLTLGGCESVYDDTKGWGVDLWEDIKKGSKQAANSTKKALDSLAESDDSSVKNSNDQIEKTELSASDNSKEAPKINPAPLKNAEKIAQPPVIKESGNYAVHLSSNKSKQNAEKEWTDLRNAFPKETSGLSLKLKSIKITGKGTFYRVLGVGFDNKSDANKACEAFKRKKQYCMPIKL